MFKYNEINIEIEKSEKTSLFLIFNFITYKTM